MSQLIMISKPPASAEPFAAQMRGLVNSRWVMPPKPWARDRKLTSRKGLEVHAGTKGLVTSCGEDDHPDVVVGLGLVERDVQGRRRSPG